ncbi:MAG: hypothetical protein ACD_39C00889G0003 [uncultured bacterium]|nr:MAG: hypothetical protein ACD_39C00889G0003 [uncultured bacterium]
MSSLLTMFGLSETVTSVDSVKTVPAAKTWLAAKNNVTASKTKHQKFLFMN